MSLEKILVIPLAISLVACTEKFPVEVSILSPAEGDIVTGTVDVTVGTNTQTYDMDELDVQFYVDGDFQQLRKSQEPEDSIFYYEWSTEDLEPDAEYTLWVELRGQDDAILGADSVQVTVRSPLKWYYDTGRWGWSTAIDLDGHIYWLTVDRIFKFSSKGELLDDFLVPCEFGSGPGLSIGTDGTLYITGQGDKEFYALNPDGTLKWSYTTGSQPTGAAIGSDGTIYVTSDGLYAFYPDGTLRWHFQTERWAPTLPAISSEGTIYFGSNDCNVYAVNPDGTERCRYETGGEVEFSPMVDAECTVYIGSKDGYLYAIDSSGILKWRFESGDNPIPQAIGEDGTVYFSPCYAFDTEGNLKWRFSDIAAFSYGALSSDGTLYLTGGNSLYSINSDGEELWHYNPAFEGLGGMGEPVIGPDETVYIGEVFGNLYAFEGSSSLASSPWPMFGHDPQHTRRID